MKYTKIRGFAPDPIGEHMALHRPPSWINLEPLQLRRKVAQGEGCFMATKSIPP